MMKNKNKLILTLLVALLLCFVAAAALSSCDEPETVEIYITSADMPRLNYVEGQELDLTDGKLTVSTNGNETKLPLTSSEITVEGYNKKTLGDQVLTVKYGSYTTNITVNVIARAIAESFETKYFVGDEFNKNMGKIRIATDDAKLFKVNMNDPKVSLVSFDSSTAGTATVTVLYNDGSNSYYCQFDVTVYDQSNIQFTPPQKTTYFSHDTAVNVSGGYFTVTSSDSTLTKNVPLTDVMVKSFDLSAATMEHRETPLEQAVTVEYLGKTFQYNIYVTFSDISAIDYYTQGILSKIDWEKVKEDGLSDEESEAAIDAINTYLDLSEAQKELVSAETMECVMRAGSVALSNAFLKEVGNYSKTFTMNAELNLFLVCESYEQTVADLKKLTDSEEKINQYATLLRQIEADYGKIVVEGETTVADCIYVYTEEMQQLLVAILTHFVEVHELIADIPDDWTAETLKAHGTDIVAAAMKINQAGYYKSGYSRYYTNFLSKWRANNDLFELLYTYFLYDYENGTEFMANYMWGAMPMPGRLENWYVGLSNALYYEQYFSQNSTSKALLADISGFMYYYFSTLEIAEEIKKSGNQLWIDIYNAYGGDDINRRFMYTPSYGYLYHIKGMNDSEAFHTLWARYYTVLKAAMSNSLSVSESKTDICAMFDAFQALSPSELLGFLSSMNLMYTATKGVLPMLQYSEEAVYNIFMLVMRDYYSTYMNERTEPLFQKLLLAMENFALVGYKEGALEEFQTLMQEIESAFIQLSDTDKANFNKYAGISYNKYLTLYKAVKGESMLVLSAEETALLADLKLSIEQYYTAYTYMYNLAQESEKLTPDLYAVLYALYTKASGLYHTVLSTVGADALTSLYTVSYEILDGTHTLDKAFFIIDTTTTSMLSGQNATVTDDEGNVTPVTYWDLLANYGLDKVLTDMTDILYYAYFNKEAVPAKSYVLALMESVRALTPFQQSIFTFLSIETAYHNALNTYFEATLTKPEVASTLIEAEKAYTAYTLDSENAEKRTGFITLMEQLATAYAALSDEDKSYLDGMYQYYLAAYEKLTATTQQAA